jgi:hypothetical protein
LFTTGSLNPLLGVRLEFVLDEWITSIDQTSSNIIKANKINLWMLIGRSKSLAWNLYLMRGVFFKIENVGQGHNTMDIDP